MSGSFIVLDGPDGCGKSTQARLLVQHLRDLGGRPQHLRDPGGTHLGEALRTLLLEGRDVSGRHGPELHPRAELMLFFASRLQLAHEQIRPAVARGEVVICERWISSTYAYQGCASGEDAELVLQLGRALMPGEFPPTRTILLDIDPAVALARACEAGNGADRIESRGNVYHEKVRHGFLRYAERFPAQTHVVAVGDRSAAAVRAEILEILGFAPPPGTT